ncbi:TPA: ROK family protein [Klebsiella variicola subsp. variicola]|uniref:ROK family protein n=1 Tax=Klebsiella variicola TaxID=244366 RepID=UPI003FA5470E
MNETIRLSELHSTQRILLDLVRQYAPVSRAELSRLSGLTPGTITQQCRELIFSGLVVEGERNTGQRGQPSLPLRLNPAGGCAIGLAFSPGFIDLSVVDLSGHRLCCDSVPHIENQSLETSLNQIKILVELTLKKRHLHQARIIGVGYGVPGFLKADRSSRHCVTWLSSWRDTNLQKVFEENLPWPTWVENNANASAVGEFYSGMWNSYRNLTFLDLGYGIGAGIIADGKLMRGGFLNAGEVGTAFPLQNARPSMKDLEETIEHAGFNAQDLPTLLASRHPVTEAWLSRSADQLETSIMGCVQWIDPELIIIGGAMPKEATSRLVGEMALRLDRNLNPHQPRARIVSSPMGAESASYGAAMLPLYRVINQE